MTNELRTAWVLRAVYATLVVALVAALAVVSGAGSAPARLAAGDGAGPTITIDGTAVEYSAGPDQALGNGPGCVLSTSGGQVLSFSGGGEQVGFVDGSIGVKSKGNGQDCGQVDGDEALTVDLGPAVTGAGSAVGTAVLDVEVLQDASVTVTAYFVDGDKVSLAGVFGLGTGANATPGADDTPESTTGSPVASCNPQSSSGPNAAEADNCYWTIVSDSPFNRFVITETAGGKVSLQGGGDWPDGSVGGPTVLHLVDAPDGILDCGDDDQTGDAGLGGVIERLDDDPDNPGADCELKPYFFKVEDGQVKFAPEGDSARYSAGITKTVAAGQPIDGADWIQIDVDGDGTDFGFVPMEWCLSAEVVDVVEEGEFTGRLVERAVLPDPGPGGDPVPWCVAAVDVGDPAVVAPASSGTATSASDPDRADTVVATFWLYGEDDPNWK